MVEQDKDTAAAENANQGQFAIQKVYVKDLSFETPHSPGIFQEKWSPSVNMDLSNGATPLGDHYYEVVLSITVTVSFENKTVYLVEVQQAGIFHILGFNEKSIEHLLATVCPNMLFPFAREIVSDLVTRGGFPQLLLAPVNFEALFQEQTKKKSAAEQQASGTKH